MKLKHLLAVLPLLLVSCKEPKPEPIPYEVFTIDKSGTTIDCKGKEFNSGKNTEIRIISSKKNKVENVAIKNCKLKGSIRTVGLGFNGESEGVNKSSKTEGHTQRAQEEAPSNILISNVQIEGVQRIPIYIGPGTTKVTVEDTKFTGTSNTVVIYMDTESGFNTIKNSVFDVTPQYNMREVIAVDGSAYNKILNNTFEQATKGGIYLYRNCGEGGTVRHQSPQYNTISGNKFNLEGLSWDSYGIWLSSRNGNRSYCEDDAGYPFGSSIDNRDFADYNTVVDNKFDGSFRKISDNGNNNKVQNDDI
jgi:parallel beta-helix repeat protein